MNTSKYGDISKMIASYLKMDFQREVLMQIIRKNKKDIRRTAFISDEYQEYITKNDAEFYAQSRETMCINIVATQSYSSLYNTVKDEFAVDVIIQSFVNKIWYRQDDIRTIEKAQKIIGKEEKEKVEKELQEKTNEINLMKLEISKAKLVAENKISEHFTDLIALNPEMTEEELKMVITNVSKKQEAFKNDLLKDYSITKTVEGTFKTETGKDFVDNMLENREQLDTDLTKFM